MKLLLCADFAPRAKCNVFLYIGNDLLESKVVIKLYQFTEVDKLWQHNDLN